MALTLLPAMLGFFGERLRPQPATRAKKVGGFNASRWWVGVVTKYPIITIVLVVAALGALSVPAKDPVSYTHLDVYKRQGVHRVALGRGRQSGACGGSQRRSQRTLRHRHDLCLGQRRHRDLDRAEASAQTVDRTGGRHPRACLLYTSRCV